MEKLPISRCRHSGFCFAGGCFATSRGSHVICRESDSNNRNNIKNISAYTNSTRTNRHNNRNLSTNSKMNRNHHNNSNKSNNSKIHAGWVLSVLPKP